MIAEKYAKRAGRVADELRVSEVVDARRTLVTGRVIQRSSASRLQIGVSRSRGLQRAIGMHIDQRLVDADHVAA
jgi:hypothetical protein